MMSNDPYLEQTHKQALTDAAIKEDKFFERYAMPEGLRKLSFEEYQRFLNEEMNHLNNQAWVYNSPLARKMFQLGFLYAWVKYRREATFK